jgi:hypothetical protein
MKKKIDLIMLLKFQVNELKTFPHIISLVQIIIQTKPLRYFDNIINNNKKN